MGLVIEWSWGRPSEPGAFDDEQRAIEAAECVFDELGVEPGVAYAAYSEWVETGFGSYEQYAWSKAEQAAEIAATQGWADPDGAALFLGWVD